MDDLNKPLEIRTSPHIVNGASVEDIMRNVVWAMLPVVLFAIYAFHGWSIREALVCICRNTFSAIQ